MGLITVFVRKPCRFCDVVLSVLASTIEEVRASFAREGRPRPHLVVDVVDCTRDVARANQCRALSGGSTVPQVFFNGVRVGTCTECEAFKRTGELYSRLAALAVEPSVKDFPPSVPATVVKVT